MPRLEPGELVTSSTRFAAFETMQGPQLEDQLFNYVSHLFAHCLDLVVACKWNTHHHRPACEFFSHSKPCRVHSWRTNYSMRAKVHTHGLRLVRGHVLQPMVPNAGKESWLPHSHSKPCRVHSWRTNYSMALVAFHPKTSSIC